MEDKFKIFNKKKKASEKNVIIGTPVLIIGVLGIYFTSGEQAAIAVISILLIIVGLVFLGKGMFAFSKIKKDFKLKILKPMFNEIIPNVSYEPTQGLSASIVYSTDFLKKADRYHSEDYLSGKIDGVDFISSDVKLEERHVQQTKNGTRVYYVTYFLGRVFRFEFNKEFAGALHVLEGGSPRSRGFKKVKLESIDFNKKFKTYATEDITAFYILTPDIMEALFALEKRNPGRIGLSFRGEYMYVAINNNKDTFELKMFRQIDDSMIQEFKRDLLVIKDFIVTLKLNNNLFKK